MTRVSLEEQYNNKDVITQILKMRDDIARIAANAAGIQDITLTTTATGWKFTFTLTDGTSYVFPLDTTGYITDAELAAVLADYYTKTEIDNAFANYYTKTETDTALGAKANDNAVVKLTGNQTIDDTKTFLDSPIVPTEPDGNTGSVNKFYVNDSTGTYVNNLIHKDGDEDMAGTKTVKGLLVSPMEKFVYAIVTTNAPYGKLFGIKPSSRTEIIFDLIGLYTDMTTHITIATNNTAVGNTIVNTQEDLTGINVGIFMLYNSVTDECEVWVNVQGRFWFYPKLAISGNAAALDISSLTMYGTTQATDPSLDTTTYPNGKDSLTMKIRDLSK